MAAPRIAIRCDGGAALGAGHVARCRPIAMAFANAGYETCVIGRLDGLAAWTVHATGLSVHEPSAAHACGIDPTAFEAAVVDLYGIAEDELCVLASALPIATLGEAASCPASGVVIDYHLDRTAVETGPRLLAGPSYAPVDPAFTALRRERHDARCALVTLGGSTAARSYGEPVIATVAEAYPAARLLVAAGIPAPDHVVVERPDEPMALTELAGKADFAVTAAGMTAYELASAGVPFVALVVADNQERVGQALEESGVGLVLDIRGGVDSRALLDRLSLLSDDGVRQSLTTAGLRAFDGRGAARIVDALALRWGIAR